MTTHDSNERVQQELTIGSYPTLARAFLGLSARLVESAAVEPGAHVLDVACGTGNVALTAHRRGADVTGVDITPAMLAAARARAATLDADIDWREGDAAALPFEDDAFDVTLSCLGHTFAHDATAAATELVRVTRPGGRLAFTAWTPESANAAMMKVLSEHLPPRPNAPPPPVLWGDPATVRERLGASVETLRFETGSVQYPAVSPAHFWESMTTDSGAIVLMLESVDDHVSLHAEEAETLGRFFSPEHNAVELEYLLVTATV
jgi:SAM-dependent methyltransferase